MSTQEDRLVYHTEDLAFTGTPLGDQLDRSSLILETRELAAHPSIQPLVGTIMVTEGTARYAAATAHAQGQQIVFAPNLAPHYIPVHELAHVVHRRAGLGGRSHGPEWRAMYCELIAIAYGLPYGDLLRQAFCEVNLTPHHATLQVPIKPVIDIDRLTDASRGVRWL